MLGILVLLPASMAWSGFVTPESAQRVAQGRIWHHIAVYGSWNGSTHPVLKDPETICEDGRTLAYLFDVEPGGTVIVAADDELSPVPFYSARSTFDFTRAENPNAIESWMFFRLRIKASAAETITRRAAADRVSPSSRIRDVWSYFDGLNARQAQDETARNLSANISANTDGIIRGAKVDPLLTTTWGQDVPYNNLMPDDGCNSGHTLTGCVATAWAQVLNYWQWPPSSSGGQGEKTHTWNGEDFYVDFSNTEAYDWANMPADLTAADTTQAQIDAVSKLMYYLAVAVETDFGCTNSGSMVWADQVLDTHFKYKPLDESNNRLNLLNYSAQQWFSVVKNELDADPARPIIFSIGSPDGWHEVVIDGYEEGAVDTVHINFGWNGNSDGYWDITADDTFNAGGFDWDVEQEQVMVIGIEPDRSGESANPLPSFGSGDDSGGGCFLSTLIDQFFRARSKWRFRASILDYHVIVCNIRYLSGLSWVT